MTPVATTTQEQGSYLCTDIPPIDSDMATIQENSHLKRTPARDSSPRESGTDGNCHTGRGHSFRRIVNITGSAHDGTLANSYPTDERAQWDQGGYVHEVQVRNPFTGSWDSAEYAIDTSGVEEGKVTRFNRPFSSWYYHIDMTVLAGEGDYTFEFRAFDGIDYSPVVSRTINLNTQPPLYSSHRLAHFRHMTKAQWFSMDMPRTHTGVQMPVTATSVWYTWTYLDLITRLQAQSRQMKTGLGLGMGLQH